MGYILSIKLAMLLFPALAFVITLPYMIAKYGSVNKLRTLIVYSFALYLLTVYLLVILPLPNPESIHTRYTDMLNLVPFAFVIDFIKNSPFSLSNSASWIMALKHPSFYVPAFNVLMLIPFGIYMRYYFKCSFKKTMLLTALLSLFFELTQLSGLYFIYSGPYRLGDIDDIIQNTTGGCLGYLIGWVAVKILPSRDRIDEKSLELGTRVSGIRVLLSLIIDTLIVFIPYSLSKTEIPSWPFIAGYFALIPLLNGKTFGSALLRFKIEFDGQNWARTVLRAVYFALIPQGLIYLTNEFNKHADDLLYLCLLVITLLVLLLYALITIACVLLSKRLLFDRLVGTKYRSTIKIDN